MLLNVTRCKHCVCVGGRGVGCATEHVIAISQGINNKTRVPCREGSLYLWVATEDLDEDFVFIFCHEGGSSRFVQRW